MTEKILIDRAVVEQALEALDEADLLMEHRQNIELRRSALVALREALENQFNPDWDRVEAMQEALREHMAEIQRLRAALEQSDIEIPASVPEGWKLVPVEPTNEMVQAWLDTYEGNIQTVYRAMLAAAPQPPVVEQPQVEQEPVAWLHADGKHQPLYTHQQNLNCKSTQAQPPRQPLTDEEITELADAHMEAFAQFVGAGEVWFEGEKEFARAIEAAHGIGGEK